MDLVHRIQPLRHVTLILLGASALALAPHANAGVEFVTAVGQCTKVDTIGDGKDAAIQAGSNVKLEVWGDGIDVNPAVRVAVDSGSGTVSAQIKAHHGGTENRCGFLKGSVEVEVDSPEDLTQSIQRSLFFRMPLGDESRLQTKIIPFNKVAWVWNDTQQNPANCLTKGIGTIQQLNQNELLDIQLPPGSATDQSNCVVTLNTRATPDPLYSEVDISAERTFGLAGAPTNLLTATPDSLKFRIPGVEQPRFTLNIANVRAITANQDRTMTLSVPNGRSDTLQVVLHPGGVNGFTQAARCANAQTGTTINANDTFQCEIKLAVAPTNGQLITFEAVDRSCVAGGADSVHYKAAIGVGTITVSGAGTIFQIPLRALGGTASAGTPCASEQGVAHLIKIWIGDRDIESGLDFTQAQIRIRSLK
jgi:hypothetical protein